MDFKVIWSDAAIADLNDICSFLDSGFARTRLSALLANLRRAQRNCEIALRRHGVRSSSKMDLSGGARRDRNGHRFVVDIQPDQVGDLAYEFPFLLGVAAANILPKRTGESLRDAQTSRFLQSAVKHESPSTAKP